MLTIESENKELEASLLVLLTFIQKSIDEKKPIKIEVNVESDIPMSILEEKKNLTRDNTLYRNVNLDIQNLKFHL